MRRDGVYKNAENERTAKRHKARRIKLWQERIAAIPQKCRVCDKPIEPKYKRGGPQQYCSRSCKARAYSRWESTGQPSGVVGAVGELIVSADLLRRGHYVYRALTPCAPFDLAIWSADRLLRIEVTKASRARSGKPIFNAHDAKNYDVLALWYADGTVTYMPELPMLSAGPLKYSDEDGRAAAG